MFSLTVELIWFRLRLVVDSIGISGHNVEPSRWRITVWIWNAEDGYVDMMYLGESVAHDCNTFCLL